MAREKHGQPINVCNITKQKKDFEFPGNIITYSETDIISFLLCVAVKCKFNIFKWFILRGYS
ncbi:hypothetical protein ARC310_04850 [Pantoea ananatis]|nr:hypothetical protein KR94_16855 [Pantoea ananatis]PZD61200.1 hypothetical protein ARC311_16345 [Pantoea ananatis]PZD66911.1 hypothetical protein ARC310_04850 [Pantoea ananatis]